MTINTHKEPGQTSQQDKFKEKILNILKEHVLEQILCPMMFKQRLFLYLSPFCLILQKMEEQNASYDISKLYSILLEYHSVILRCRKGRPNEHGKLVGK